MQRIREAPPVHEESTPSLQDAPRLVREARPLLERLASLRAPGVTSEEIDTFLAGLKAPRPSDEPPRVRADLMLDVLEDEWLCGLTGGQGQRLGEVALEALLGLGYPYALEVTPEMLAQARGSPPARFPLRPLLGLGLAGVNVLLPLGLEAGLVEFAPSLLDDDIFFSLRSNLWPSISLALLGPPVASALAGWFELPALKRLSNALQWMVAGLTVWGASIWSRETPLTGVLFMLTALLSLATVLCLTPPKEPEP
jgi:hypothetical protein